MIPSVVSRAEVARILDIAAEQVVCLVGGGGKTSLLLAFGASLTGGVLTTTTKMGADRTGGFPVHWLSEPPPAGGGPLAVAVPDGGPLIVWERREGMKAIGVSPETIDGWVAAGRTPVVVEADGARHLPFKAPAGHEPVIPASTTLVVAVIGADALGRVIADQCFRPLRVAAIAGCQPYQRLTPERAASVLLSPRGSRRRVASTMRYAVAITKVDPSSRDLALELADRLAQAAAPPDQVVLVADEGVPVRPGSGGAA